MTKILIVEDEESYAIDNRGSGWSFYKVRKTGREWKEMIDEAVNKRKGNDEN